MDTTTLFSASGLLALPFWAAMIVLPTWRWTRRVIGSPLIIAAAAALYAVLVLPRLVQIVPAVANPTLAGISALLGTETGATIAWVHFLAFDLFVGRWIYLDSRARGLHPLLVCPVLLLTLLLGPLGFLMYLATRATVAYATSSRSVALAARRILAVDPLLAFLTVGASLLFIGTLVGLADDPRVITGAPAWLKPMKFAISIAIYSATFLWLLTYIDGHRRLVRLAASLTAVTGTLELIVIVGQVIRGTTSHFNTTTALDGALFSIMGASIVVLWTMALLLGVLLLRQRFADPAFAWSLRLAVVLSLIGMAVAFLMVTPTPEQHAALAAGLTTSVGAHSVGVPDGGAGLPIVGWSTLGGDLRAPHFIGLHALQVLPLIGWLLARPSVTRGRRALSAAHRSALVWLVGLFYGGLIATLTWQALRGQSVVAPDAQTLAAFAALLVAIGVAAVAVTAHGLRTPRSPAMAASAAPAV